MAGERLVPPVLFHLGPVEVTATVAYTLVASGVVVGFALLARWGLRRGPAGWAIAAEFVVEHLEGVMQDMFGRDARPFVPLVVTLALHLLLTRTALGSKMLAVSEDSTAAQLMGIRPDTMQAIAWAIAAGATGLAGALIATFFYIVPTVGETLGIVAFVTVSLGGFGSVPGALVAGLLIGVIESVSGYLIGAVYKDIVVYSLFIFFLWFRPQGLMGKA